MADGPGHRRGVDLALLAAAGRDAALITLPAVTIASLAGAWRAHAPGMAGWDFAGDTLLDSVRVSGPVTAGAAAWLAIRSECSGLGQLERLSCRSPAAGPLTRLAFAAAATLGGYTLTAGALAAWLGVRDAASGGFTAAEVAAGAAALLAHLTVGFLAGLLLSARRFRPGLPVLVGRFSAAGRVGSAIWGAASAAAIAGAVAGATRALDAQSGTGLASATRWPRLLLSPDIHHSPFTQWRPGLFAAAITWFGGISAAAILAAGWALTRQRWYAIAFAAATVVASTGLGALRADTAHPLTDDSAPVVCQNWPLKVCVNPAFAPALPQLESVFTAVATRVSGTRAAVRSVTQLPPGARISHSPGGYGFHLDDLRDGYAWRAATDLSRQITATLAHLPPAG